jgi:guanylate kinase
MNTLQQADDFKKILSSYEMSTDSKALLGQTKFVMLSAISASGRNTIIEELLKTDQFYPVVSDTTREKRINDGIKEESGKQYWFRSEEEVLERLNQGKYIEAALIHDQQVSGLSIEEFEKAAQAGKIAISDLEVQGVDVIMKASPTSIPIFVVPPSYDEWMKRWVKRGVITETEKQHRLESARKELHTALHTDYYHFVINDALPEAVQDIIDIANNKGSKDKEVAARSIAEKLLDSLE